jgi:hypothetical protein
MASSVTTPWAPRWLYRWAVLTVVATALLLLLGSVVTTFRVGMADPVWPTYPWHLLLISWDEPSAGFLIEHTHRLVGYLVGCCVIVLSLGLWLVNTPRWLKTLGWLTLACVIVQGLLGGFRVRLNALLGPNLAIIHGVCAQVVFCLLVSLAVLTAPRFRSAALPFEESRSLRRIAGLLAHLSLLQLILGVLVRHLADPIAQRLHFVTAFAVVATATWLTAAAAARPAAWRMLRGPLTLLGLFLLVQVLLGVEAWLAKFTGPQLLPELVQVTIGQAVIRTAHVLLGSWILATSVALTLLLCCPTVKVEEPATNYIDPRSGAIFQTDNGIQPAHQIEGIA